MNEPNLEALGIRKLPDDCLSDLTLDRLRCGDLAAEVVAAAEQHLSGCDRCRTRAQSLAAESQALAGELPQLSALLAAARVRGPMDSAAVEPSGANREDGTTAQVVPLASVRAFRKWWAPTLGVVAAAAAMLLFIGRSPEPEGEIRLKGVSGELDVFVKRAGKVFRWQDQALQPGDQLRYSFRAPEPLHVMVLSREASGAVNQYFPAEPGSFAVDLGVTLSKSATELDATLGRETLWVVFCQRAFTADAMLGQLQATGVIAPGEGCATQRLELTKVAP